jgi:putative methylase
MDQRLVRRLDLERAISRVDPHPSPTANLEQYTITPEIAAQILFIATYTNDDIIGKTVADLGCGTGRLAIGGALMGAKEVVGVDIDKVATTTASKNAEKLGMKEKTQWVTGEVTVIKGGFDTVLQNPPFGIQRRKADRKFLRKALEIAEHVYSLHKSSQDNPKLVNKLSRNRTQLLEAAPSPFLNELVEEYGGEVKAVYTMLMTIPRMFHFHTKPRHQFLVDVYIIERKALPM